MTTKLYQKDVYIRDWEATVLSIDPARPRKGHPLCFDLTLDQSAFFPEGGGQGCDTGTIGGCRVIDVQESGDQVIHTVAAGADAAGDSGAAGDSDEAGGSDAAGGSGAAASLPFAAGDRVSCALDWDRRFDHMQRHCGEHILSGIFYARCGGVNRGFHMGEEYMTIDISLEDDPTDPDTARPEKIDMALALECEQRANRVIWNDEKVTVFRFDERDEVKDMPLRKALAFDEDISIVCVGSPENASDCVACCGTHPSTAGQVGLIKIYKVENYKGMFRIYFEAGRRALADYDRKHGILTDLANAHSSSIDDFPGKVRALEEKLASVKDELFHAKKALISRERERLDQLLSEGEGPLVFTLPDLSLDDAFDMAKLYMGKTPRLILLYARPDTSFILVSDGSVKCGSLVREYASFYNGKGGGSDTSARAIFTGEEDAMLFADLVGKHLR